jgi:CRP/FNR family nitrogen fixation transcriptional regulator
MAGRQCKRAATRHEQRTARSITSLRVNEISRQLLAQRECSARDVFLRAPIGRHMFSGALRVAGTPVSFGRNQEIYGEGEPAEHLYKVIKGAVRTCKILSDGRRQIVAFQLPGDVFGLEYASEHELTAEAVTETIIVVYKYKAIFEIAEHDGEAARELWSMTVRQLKHAQDHVLLLARSAQERVVAFLLEMAARVSSGETVELPMSRQDIADYLGLTIETVSRTLTQLENNAAIELPSVRQIVLSNRSSLHQLNA